MIVAHWNEIANNTHGQIKYKNASNTWIANYVKMSNTYGAVDVIGTTAMAPMRGTAGTTWTWYDYVSNSDVQSGVAVVNLTANGITEFSVTFPVAFANDPSVTTSILTSRPDLRSASPTIITKTGFTGTVYNNSSAGSVRVSWIAK